MRDHCSGTHHVFSIVAYQVLMYEVYSGGKVPYSDLTAVEVMRAVAAGRRLGRPSSATWDEAFNLMRSCMMRSKTDRPTMIQALDVLYRLLMSHELETEL